MAVAGADSQKPAWEMRFGELGGQINALKLLIVMNVVSCGKGKGQKQINGCEDEFVLVYWIVHVIFSWLGLVWIIFAVFRGRFGGGRTQHEPPLFLAEIGCLTLCGHPRQKECTKSCELTLKITIFSASEGAHPRQTPPVSTGTEVLSVLKFSTPSFKKSWIRRWCYQVIGLMRWGKHEIWTVDLSEPPSGKIMLQ